MRPKPLGARKRKQTEIKVGKIRQQIMLDLDSLRNDNHSMQT